MINKILLGVHDSPHSRKGLEIIRKISSRDKTPVILVTVMPPIANLIGGSDREQLHHEHEREGSSILDEFKAVLEREGIPVRCIVAEGDAADEILSISEAEGCDLIVVGARGLSRIEVCILGSVTQKVMQHATVPVLIAR